MTGSMRPSSSPTSPALSLPDGGRRISKLVLSSVFVLTTALSLPLVLLPFLSPHSNLPPPFSLLFSSILSHFPKLPPPPEWLVNLDARLPGLCPAIGFSVLAAWATGLLIPILGQTFKEAGFKGKDLLKKEMKEIPESMGTVAASVYLLLLFIFVPFRYFGSFSSSLDPDSSPRYLTSSFESLSRSPAMAAVQGLGARPTGAAGETINSLLSGLGVGVHDGDPTWEGRMGGRGGFPHHELASFLSSLLSLLTATFLGFLDDTFDIRWRYKLPIPIVASVPLLVVYYAGMGGTHVVMPNFVRAWVGRVIDLGPFYYFYMALLSTFCTNSINILAGINGVEVGQTLVIALSVALNDLLNLDLIGGKSVTGEAVRRHLFSLYFVMPLIGVCLGLLWHNHYPARVFPGDTFCYFAGMAFAVVAILGHFSKTILLFFLPQIFNFLLSAPQLFGIVECPRHRLPRLDPSTGLLQPSLVYFERPPSRLTSSTLTLFSALGLVRLERLGAPSSASTGNPSVPGSSTATNRGLANSNSFANGEAYTKPNSAKRDGAAKLPPAGGRGRGVILSSTNLTIINFALVRLGPMREPMLFAAIMALQVFGTVVAFGVRYGLAGWVYSYSS